MGVVHVLKCQGERNDEFAQSCSLRRQCHHKRIHSVPRVKHLVTCQQKYVYSKDEIFWLTLLFTLSISSSNTVNSSGCLWRLNESPNFQRGLVSSGRSALLSRVSKAFCMSGQSAIPLSSSQSKNIFTDCEGKMRSTRLKSTLDFQVPV